MSKYEWLSIRETLDRCFRHSLLAHKFMEHASKTRLIVDLGCGTGTNFRYLSGNSESNIPWLCIDSDDEVLKLAASKCTGQRVRFARADLAEDWSSIPLDEEIAITASAFLDLTSEPWLVRFAGHVSRAPLLISMTSSGVPIWDPVEELDEGDWIVLGPSWPTRPWFWPGSGFVCCTFVGE